MVEVVKAELHHCEELAPRLREIDVKEIRVVDQVTPLVDLLKLCVSSASKAFAVVDDQGCLAVFGVRDMNNKSGIPWFLSSPIFFTKYYRRFIKETPQFLDELWGDKTYLFNYISKDNKTSRRWLTKLGFTVHIDKPLRLKDDNIFYYFDFTKET